MRLVFLLLFLTDLYKILIRFWENITKRKNHIIDKSYTNFILKLPCNKITLYPLIHLICPHSVLNSAVLSRAFSSLKFVKLISSV